MDNKKTKFLKRSMYLILFLFPFLLSMFGSIKAFSGIKTDKTFSVLIMVIVILILFLLCNIIKRINKIKRVDKFINIPIIIFLSAFIFRLFSVYILGNKIEQISDFLLAHNNAINGIKGNSYIATFSHWALYPKILSFFYNIFGSKFFIGQMINVTLASIVAVLMYYITILVFNSVKPAIIVSIVYLLWPSNILYVNIYTNEFFAMFFLTTCILISLKCIDNENSENNYKNIILFVILGMLLAISDFFKPFSMIIIISFLITQILYNLSSFKFLKFKELCKLKKVNIKNNKIVLTILMIFIYCFSRQIIFVYLEGQMELKVNKSALAYSIYVGLDVNNGGVYSDEAIKKYSSLIESNYGNYNKANEKIIKDAKLNLKENYKLIPKLFDEKINISWFSEIQQVERWIIYNIKDEGFLKNDIGKLTISISQLYYMSMIFFILISIIISFNRLDNKKLFLCSLYVLGIACAFLLTEAQGRYKSVIIPMLSLLAGWGIYNISTKIEDVIKSLLTYYKKINTL
ncbi:hypothetical protein [Clostridium sp. ZBS18]|uniref:hypothetical protein n=1 Tax=Clostridium sp. ZBS18 TaxID=2949967 RepID=UPI002079A3EA|nr:hypothetical protein [Clostridium sp. ZBS18]